MRIAFVSPHFGDDFPSGVCSSLKRITRSLHNEGHEVEIFIPSSDGPGEADSLGIKVHRVQVVRYSLFDKIVRKIASIFTIDFLPKLLSQSWRLCNAIETRHKERPFDAVQYADSFALGLFMRRKTGRKNIVRCSRAIELYHRINGNRGARYRWGAWLEVFSIRRADQSYAPSTYVAQFYKDKYGIEMKVIRSPLDQVEMGSKPNLFGLPTKYFIHFGQLCLRKGTYWLIDSLKLAFKEDPTIRVVMVGPAYSNNLENRLSALGEYRQNVLALHPLRSKELYSVLVGARAAILPSLVDNLPNTIIESLQHGVPVIGSRGASIDEIVEAGVTGELAELGNTQELSELIVKFWQEKTHIKRGFNWKGIPGEVDSTRALLDLFELPRTATHITS